jgi:apolipoprotein D and lipocalin family protein
MRVIFLAGAVAACGCAGIPDNVTAVEGFELERYLGTWYEIARLDHSFERGLSHVSAVYCQTDGGGVSVVNRGYDAEAGEWSVATGTAYFVGEPNVARLKVSFFWPFYGGYNVIKLDKEAYAYALVCGPDRSYLWVLAREKELDPAVLQAIVAFAREKAFPVDDLIYVDHRSEVPPPPPDRSS